MCFTNQTKMRKDKQKSLDKVAKERLKDPLATQREVAERAEMSQSSVDRARKEAGKYGSKDPFVVSILEWDKRLMNTIQWKKEERLLEPNKVSNKEIDLREKTANQRYSIFAWEVTDNSGWLKESKDVKVTIVTWEG